jgi:glycosyltransferase involved in cell wall biosynthesis
MRIALLSGEYPPQPGGVGDYTRQLGLALAARGHAVAALTIQAGRFILYDLAAADEHGPARDEQIVIWPTRSAAGRAAPLDWSPRCWPAVISALGRYQPDWLHIQYQTGAYAMRPGVNLLPWRLRRLPGGPLVAVTFHDLLEPYLLPKAGPLRRWVNRRLARDADAVVATNAADAAGLRALGASPVAIPIGSNISVAPPPGYQRASWRAALGVGDGELLVAYFGLLSPSKGVDLLIEGLAGLERPWRLLLIGGAATAPQDIAYAAATRAAIERRGLAGRVIATGHVDEAAVSAHLLAADVAALPFRDGASLRRGSLLAALAHGCPLLTTASADPEAAALLRDGDTALLAPQGDAGALRAGLARLGAEPALRARLAAAGRALAARFSWEQIAEQHERLYGRG